MIRASLRHLGLSAAALLAAVTSAGAASAQAPGKPAPLPPPPLSVRVIAPSPDPAWTLRIDNEGERPVRIPADVRLLTLELERPGGRGRVPCKPAPGQRPGRFPKARELVLAPGESWVERFDPRLFCFDAAGELLRGGTIVRARFGFDGRGAAAREPFVAQSLDAPATFAPAKELRAPTILLSHGAGESSPPDALPVGASRANAPLDRPPPPAPPPPAEAKEGAAAKTPAEIERERLAEAERERARERQAERDQELAREYAEPPVPQPVRDRQAGDLDLRTHPWSDAAAPRDLVLRLRAENEGGRALAAVLRSRMLRFRVEGPLLPDNKTEGTAECIVDERSHGVPVEMVRSYRPGDRLDIPFLLAEVCPRGTFDRPGLFRVTPVLAASIEGEAVEHQDAFQGRIRALQPVLARVGSSRLPFYDGPPKAARLGDTPGEDRGDEPDSSDAGPPAASAPDESP